MLSLIPGFASVLPKLVSKLNAMRDKYLAPAPPVPNHLKVSVTMLGIFLNFLHAPDNHLLMLGFYLDCLHIVKIRDQVKKWDLSFASIWNTVVWLMLVNFFFKIVTATAQSFLKKQHEEELLTLKKKMPESTQNEKSDQVVR